jgi:hypothetical protein
MIQIIKWAADVFNGGFADMGVSKCGFDIIVSQ